MDEYGLAACVPQAPKSALRNLAFHLPACCPCKISLAQKLSSCPVDQCLPCSVGGRHIEAASNIVFSNGLLDPWSSGGVLWNISDSLVAVIIPEGAHHLDVSAVDCVLKPDMCCLLQVC